MRFFRHNPLPALFQKTEALDDDRLLAIVTALVLETRVDEAARAIAPRYARLGEADQFTFSLKLQGHSPEEIQAMKDGIAGKEPIDD
jgi:hypothetical protein